MLCARYRTTMVPTKQDADPPCMCCCVTMPLRAFYRHSNHEAGAHANHIHHMPGSLHCNVLCAGAVRRCGVRAGRERESTVPPVLRHSGSSFFCFSLVTKPRAVSLGMLNTFFNSFTSSRLPLAPPPPRNLTRPFFLSAASQATATSNDSFALSLRADVFLPLHILCSLCRGWGLRQGLELGSISII